MCGYVGGYTCALPPPHSMELKCRPAKDAHMHVCTPTAAAGPPGCTGLLEHMGPVLVVGTEVCFLTGMCCVIPCVVILFVVGCVNVWSF